MRGSTTESWVSSLSLILTPPVSFPQLREACLLLRACSLHLHCTCVLSADTITSVLYFDWEDLAVSSLSHHDHPCYYPPRHGSQS